MIEVVDPGPLTLVQDLGRTGLAALGVSPSGAADQASFRLANRLVGNEEGAAALEVTLGGLTARFRQRATVAVTGAEVLVVVDGVARGVNGPLEIRAGGTLSLRLPTRGVRSYVAVRGGLDVAPILGSRSTDVLSGLGPPAVAAGDRIPVGRPPTTSLVVDLAPVPALAERPALEILPTDARHRWFTDNELDAVGSSEFVVGQDSNRIALRLMGRPLQRAKHGELPPQGLVLGAVQVPPDGQPVVFLADHPVTGGYPVIGVLTATSIRAAAQARPGEAVRLHFARVRR